MKTLDRTGLRYGRLVAKECVGKNKRGEAMWLCVCDCGSEVICRGGDLTRNHTQSCGCLNKERISESSSKYGLVHDKDGNVIFKSQERLGCIWENMKKRCDNPNATKYYLYGGKGVKVCDEWNKFENFYNWAYENGYHDPYENQPKNEWLSLDRIDPNGDYCASNCRWISFGENSRLGAQAR